MMTVASASGERREVEVRGTVQGVTARALLLFVNEITDLGGEDAERLEQLMGRRLWFPLSQIDWRVADGRMMLECGSLVHVQIPVWLVHAKLEEFE